MVLSSEVRNPRTSRSSVLNSMMMSFDLPCIYHSSQEASVDGVGKINPYDGVAQAVPIPKEAKSLTSLSLTFMVFFSVSGGPYATHQTVRSGGSLYAMIGYLLCPFLIAWQETVMTSELSVAYPHSAGSVVWCEAAFGPFLGWLNGILSLTSGLTSNAIYPGLFVDFILNYIPKEPDDEEDLNPYLRFGVLSTMIIVMGWVNWSGLNVIGNTTIIIGIFTMAPFIVFCFGGLFEVDPSKWLEKPSLTVAEYSAASEYNLGGGLFPYAMVGGVLLRPFLNTLLWNHNAFDTAATFSEDCGKAPERVIPRSLHNAWWLVMIFYVFPMAVAIGVSDGDQIEWQSGYIATLASEAVGKWLGNWLIVAAGISNIALYQSQMSGGVFKLLGMAHNGLLPKFLGYRSRQGTPTNAIILSSLIIVVLSMIHLHKLIEIQNFNYGIALLLEYAAFIKLRISQPDGTSIRCSRDFAAIFHVRFSHVIFRLCIDSSKVLQSPIRNGRMHHHYDPSGPDYINNSAPGEHSHNAGGLDYYRRHQLGMVLLCQANLRKQR